MPQVIISLPNAVFPFLAHILYAIGVSGPDTEEENHAREARPTPPRRTPRQNQHRRQPQTQGIPRHRTSNARHTMRHRRVSHRGAQDSPQQDVPSNSTAFQEITQSDPQNNEDNYEYTEVDSVANDTIEANDTNDAITNDANDDANDDATHELDSPPPLTDDSPYGDESPSGDDSVDSDSEQYRADPPHDSHDSEHDGDQESERGRRRRRRAAEDAGGAAAEPSPTPTPHATEDREQADGARGFIGNGWWFLVLLLMVQLYQSGGFIFLCMLTLYVGFNSSAMLTYRSKSWKFKLSFLVAATITLLGTILFIYWKFHEERLWLYLIFIPSSFHFSITGALWTVWVNEFIVVFLTIVMKHYLIIMCASFRIFGQSTKKKMLAMIEQASKLYRCTIPIPVWIFYLYHAFGEEEDYIKYRGLIFSFVYIYFVAVNIRFLGIELSKIIEHKTPEEMCHRATTDDISKYAEDCAICREDLNSRSPLTLPCSHVFCTECIYQWFDKHPSCPTCRSKIGTEDMFEESSGNTNIHLQENGIGLSVSFEDL